jgi:hypothetical protein
MLHKFKTQVDIKRKAIKSRYEKTIVACIEVAKE